MEKLMKLIVLFAWLFGILPMKRPFVHYTKYRFKWLSLSTLHSFIVFASMNLFILDYLFHNGPNYFGEPGSSVPTSALIMNWIIWLVPVTNSIVIRLNMLAYGGKSVELLRNAHCLRGKLNCYRSYKGAIWMQQPTSLWRKQALFYILMLAVTIGILTFNHIKQENQFQHFLYSNTFQAWVLPTTSPSWTRWILGTVDVLMFSAVSFALSFFVVVGLELLEVVSEFGDLLKALWREPSSVITFKDLADTFELIRTSMDLFESVCGVNMFILIFNETIILVTEVYGFWLQDTDFGISGVVGSTLLICSIAVVGNHIQTRIKSVKQSVKSSMVFRNLDSDSKRLSEQSKLADITNWFLTWDFSLTAKGLFPLNNSLILMVISTCVTYIIFIFQLRSDETTKN